MHAGIAVQSLSSSWLGGLVTRVRLEDGPWLLVLHQPCRDLLAREDGRVELLFGDGPLNEEWATVAEAQARGWLVEEPEPYVMAEVELDNWSQDQAAADLTDLIMREGS